MMNSCDSYLKSALFWSKKTPDPFTGKGVPGYETRCVLNSLAAVYHHGCAL